MKKLITFIVRPENIFFIIAIFLRIYLSELLSMWYPSDQVYDDRTLVTYADLFKHFYYPNVYSLVKDMSYPLFLNFVHLTHLSYSIILSIVWVIASLLTLRIFKIITKNKLFLVFVFLFVLFTPIAFDSWAGTRLYRNSIIAPFVYIAFDLMLIILIKSITENLLFVKNILLSCLLLSFIFPFTFYIKEDGIWLLPCLILTIFTSISIVFFKYKNSSKKNKLKFKLKSKFIPIMLTLCLPIISFFFSTTIYKSINYNYFGVYEINTRTDGELGKFVSNIYKIYSPNRNSIVWAPYDAIENAFEHSKTLSEYPKLKEQIMKTPWFQGDIEKYPIKGDFLTWVLRSALVDSGVWQSEKQVSDLFKQVNSELNESFNSGLLQKDKKIQLSSSAGGRSMSEIVHLKKEIILAYKIAILLEAYIPGGGLWGNYSDLESCQLATKLTNMNMLPLNDDEITYKNEQFIIVNKITATIFKYYSILNPTMLILSIIGIFASILFLLTKINNTKNSRIIHTSLNLILIILIGISFVYSLGIGWFSEFIWGTDGMNHIILKFYSVGLVPIISLIELFGAYVFFSNIGIVLLKLKPILKNNKLISPYKGKRFSNFKKK